MRGDTGFPVRVRFSTYGKVRFISHRDIARAFERAFRITELPLAFTLGFSPRPKVSFGLALSVGFESDAEYLDLELSTDVDVESVAASLTAALPEGIDVTGVARIADRAPALQEAVSAVQYRFEIVVDDPEVAASRIDALLAAPDLVITRSRKGKQVVEDIRPAIRTLEPCGTTDRGVLLATELSTRPTGVRPGDLGTALGLPVGRVLRTHQWIERDGARLEPLEADPRSPASAPEGAEPAGPHALQARAS